jgi:Flp pilus assembly pilin Flp
MKITDRLQMLRRDEKGGEIVEWPLFAGLLVIAVIAAWGILDGKVRTAFTDIGAAVVAKTNGASGP